MQPLPIIEHLDELEHLRASVVAGVIVPLMDQLIFERTEEALDHGVVVTIPLATHAGHNASLLDQPLIRDTGVQRPLIGVLTRARRRRLAPELARPAAVLGLAVQLADPPHERASRLPATAVGPAAPGVAAIAARRYARAEAAALELRDLLQVKGLSQRDPGAENP